MQIKPVERPRQLVDDYFKTIFQTAENNFQKNCWLFCTVLFKLPYKIKFFSTFTIEAPLDTVRNYIVSQAFREFLESRIISFQ